MADCVRVGITETNGITVALWCRSLSLFFQKVKRCCSIGLCEASAEKMSLCFTEEEKQDFVNWLQVIQPFRRLEKPRCHHCILVATRRVSEILDSKYLIFEFRALRLGHSRGVEDEKLKKTHILDEMVSMSALTVLRAVTVASALWVQLGGKRWYDSVREGERGYREKNAILLFASADYLPTVVESDTKPERVSCRERVYTLYYQDPECRFKEPRVLFKYNTHTHARNYGLEFDLCRMY